jgi:metal-sulfur cluster biosynthetic enzyme
MTEPATTQAEMTESATTGTGQGEYEAAPYQETQYDGAQHEAAADASAGPPLSVGPENEDVVEALRDVVDPELGINVVDLGLVYGVTVGDDRLATIDMTLTSAACPLTDVIEDQTRSALDGLVSDFRINWVWLPPWGPDKITEDGREQLRALGFNV